MILNHKWGRYLLLIPIIFAVAVCFYFANLTKEIDHALLEEKFLEKRLNVDIIAGQLDEYIAADADWGVYNYQRILSQGLAYLDAQPFTFAALYNERLENVSERTASYTDLFEPLGYHEFMAAVTENESGTAVLSYKPPEAEARDMHIYYRWMPTDAELKGRFLAVIAVSKYSVATTAAAWVGWGAAIQTIVTTLLNIIMVAIIVRMGTLYGKRQGEKWRGDDIGLQ